MQDAIVLRIVDRTIDHMHTGGLQAALYQRRECSRVVNAMAISTVTSCVEHKVRISVIQTKVLKSHLCLLPADHSVPVVAQDDDHQIHLQTHSGFQLLAVHHETTIATHCHDWNLGIDQACRHR